LKDLVVRTETNGLVTDLVNLDHVRSMLSTISYRRRFLAQQQAQAGASDQGTIHLPAPHVILIQSSRLILPDRRTRDHSRRGPADHTAAAREQPRHRLRQTAVGRF
jgi:hypothetical protein